MSGNIQQTAADVVGTLHFMMKTVGGEARKKSAIKLSMPQFGAMRWIDDHEGASLSHVADFLGVTISAASKLIDGLVERGYIARETASDDRRRLILALTETGRRALTSVHMETLACLAEKLTKLSPGERAMVSLAMEILRTALVTQLK